MEPSAPPDGPRRRVVIVADLGVGLTMAGRGVLPPAAAALQRQLLTASVLYMNRARPERTVLQVHELPRSAADYLLVGVGGWERLLPFFVEWRGSASTGLFEVRWRPGATFDFFMKVEDGWSGRQLERLDRLSRTLRWFDAECKYRNSGSAAPAGERT